jgi:hypothetical protein
VSLTDELVEHGFGRIVRLPEIAHEWVIKEFSTRFVVDPSSYWWWESFSVNVTVEEYGLNDGLAEIERRVKGWGLKILLVTDESSRPDGSLLGLVPDLVAALRETRNFEFVLARPSLSEWFFDTHTNSFAHYLSDQTE